MPYGLGKSVPGFSPTWNGVCLLFFTNRTYIPMLTRSRIKCKFEKNFENKKKIQNGIG